MLSILCSLLLHLPKAGGPPPPNILLLIVDDLGSDMVGVYGEGDPLLRPPTPVIDALARRSVRFTQAYSGATCTPTRAMLLTGRYPFRTGIGGLPLGEPDEYVLPFHEWTIPEMLDDARSGYDHLAIGKWHLGSENSGGAFNPVAHGFRRWVGTETNLVSYYQWPKSYAERGGVSTTFTTQEYVTIDQTNEAIQRIPRLREPWFTWLAYTAPHKPFHVPPAGLHNQRQLATPLDQYRAMVQSVDREIGRLLRELHEFLPRTVILLLGDNGSAKEVAFVRPAKGTLREGGINVPFMIAGPVVPAASRGAVSDALVGVTDVFATVADIAGIDLASVQPKGHVLDSVSLLPLLQDPAGASVRSLIYSEKFSPNGLGPYETSDSMIRNERFKLIYDHLTGASEFFDLRAAPPGADGTSLCPCPQNLSPEARGEWLRLSGALLQLRGSL